MKYIVSSLIVIVSFGLLLSCGSNTPEQVAAPVQEEQAAPEVAEVTEVAGIVEVTADGTVFDPPIQIDQIPEGAWYCDMGTVHYARAEEGDGRCSECGMKLVHKVAAVLGESGATASTDEG